MVSKSRNASSAGLSRSTLWLRTAIPILGIIGMSISGYLTFIHYSQISPICSPMMDCDVVLSSPYAAIWGVPLSILGLLMYVFLTVLGFWHLRRENEWQAIMALGIYSVALSGTLFSAYLYYLEIFVIHAFCTWCIVSSLVVVITLVLSMVNLSSSEEYIKSVPRFVRVRLRRYIQW